MIDKKEQVIECVLDNKPILQCASYEYFRLFRIYIFFHSCKILKNFLLLKFIIEKKNPSGGLIRKGFFDSIIET